MDATGGIDDMTYTCLSTVSNAASQFESNYNSSNQQAHVMYVNTPQEPQAGISFHPAQLGNGVPTHSEAIGNFQSSTEMNFLPQNSGGNNERNTPVLYPSAALSLPTTTQSPIYPARNGSGGDAQPIATMAQSSTTGTMQAQGQQQNIYTGHGNSSDAANKVQPNGDVRQQYYLLNNPGAMNGNIDVVKTSSSQSNLGQGDNVAIDVGGNPPLNGAANNTVILVGANQVPLQLASGSQLLSMSQDNRGHVAVAKELQSMDQSEEPLYVNAKQYHRILKRREARAKLEALGRIPKQRKKYLHESRHLHAVNRRRMIGGKFATKS
ncbi:uncharacterized protein LOC102804243 [Saccoglossus kowalevskii]|uniref:Nuclear transcription factor Y subunit n=1 Tax=Saccoglossus kowalevskii TaxID=10224 RepID=A0ABM0N104_SACKO|nr:PREDICTED: nuclear transcription factor Y subunit alpha-like isoform X1 [Saccoglossus kowalevskii]XP_006825945.1 PREDICTED: nuclear transcription factor Y subunit alpha-like isoform X2 [Saccoglossus kowalevskii]